MMNRRLLNIFFLSIIFSTSSFAFPADSLGVNAMLSKADALVSVYDFSGAEALYEKALNVVQDTLLIHQIVARKVAAENGESMKEYVAEPSVVSRGRFSKKDFFLYCPLPDSSWVLAPNSLDSLSAIYSPKGAQSLYWSSKGDLLWSEKRDSLWSAPESISEEVESSGSEIFPMLSSSGNKLYFSSNGLYGVGGYDLYVCEKDPVTGKWGRPTNMGFPFSSPANDYLFADSVDEKYSVFASDRACREDSVDVYIVNYDPLLVRKRVDDPVNLCSIAALNPNVKTSTDGISNASVEDEEAIHRYADKMEQVRILRDTIATSNRKLNELRVEFATEDDLDKRAAVSTEIINMEKELPYIENALSKAMTELQGIEMEFLFKGVVIDPEKIIQKSSAPVRIPTYEFSKAHLGSLPEITLAQ